jgi:hypothetical protein
MLPYQALAFVAGTGARFLLADCTTRANLQREFAPVIQLDAPLRLRNRLSTRPQSTRQPYRPSTLAATPARRHRARR